jgi:hypothetical protein
MGCFVRDFVPLGDEGEQRLIRPRKSDEYLVRRRAPPGAVDDPYLRRLQKIIVLHQEIDVLDAELDREKPSVG